MLLRMEGIDKSFPGVHALDHVSLELQRGEVLALVGENGAGKSTLMRVLGGAIRPDSGAIFIDGYDPRIRSPTAARRAGISLIYQEFNLIPELTVYENILLGREITRCGLIQAAEERRRCLRLLRRIGIALDPDARCRTLSVAQQQMVEIAKALSAGDNNSARNQAGCSPRQVGGVAGARVATVLKTVFKTVLVNVPRHPRARRRASEKSPTEPHFGTASKVIVMDEPTAALTCQEVDHLFAIIRDLKRRGIGVIYISHRLDEIFAVADRVMVLRDGKHVGTRELGHVSHDALIEMMVGRSIESEFPARRTSLGAERLRVEKLNGGQAVRNVSFSVRAGEILGFAGLVGAGRTETMRIIFGADRPASGQIFVDGVEVTIDNPRDAIRSGIGLLTEDRKGQGLVLIRSARENFGLPNLDRFRHGPLLAQGKEHAEFDRYVDNLKIRISSHDQLAKNLSGGNQQKVVLAKWLERNADIIIFDEPTRGIDVGARYEIYLLIGQLAHQGKAVILISSELPEILGMSDRIVVMRDGYVQGEIRDVPHATQADILAMAIA